MTQQTLKDHKDGIMIATACIMLASGVTMSFLSFALSITHEVHDSVLWYFAQTIVYASSVFGIGAYVNYKIKGFTTLSNGENARGQKQDIQTT